MKKKLIEYLNQAELTTKEFSELAKISLPTVYNIMRGSHQPDISTARKIIKATKGYITLEDFM